MNEPTKVKVVLFDFTGVVANIRPTFIGESGPAYVAEPITDVVDAIGRLRQAEIRTGLISNNDRHSLLAEATSIDFANLFDDMFFSSDEGFAKPDPRIYRSVLRQLGAEPQTCLFFDDLPRNVDSAIDVGMQGVVVDRPSTVVTTIETVINGAI